MVGDSVLFKSAAWRCVEFQPPFLVLLLLFTFQSHQVARAVTLSGFSRDRMECANYSLPGPGPFPSQTSSIMQARG